MKKKSLKPRRQVGSTLIEALTALVVAAFGMLAIASFQVSLSQNSDVAKQRSEAVRLAQLKIEELRAYEQIASDPNVVNHKFNFTDDVVDGADEIGPGVSAGEYTTNTTYRRRWFVTGGGGDLQKWLRVEVDWQDRTGRWQQPVSLRTVIARAEPVAIGTLAVGPGKTKTRSPKDRNVDIPYPAVMLANGMSGFQPPGNGSNPFFIFDNATGDVLGSCTAPLSPGASVTWGSNCTESRALLLSGYIRFVYGTYNQSKPDDAFGNPTGLTKNLLAGIEFLNSTGTPTASCFTQRQKTIQRTGNLGDITQLRNMVFVDRLARANNVVTVTTRVPHGFTDQDYVNINSAKYFSFVGVFKITAASQYTFTYSQLGDNEDFTDTTSQLSTASLTQQVTIAEDAPIPSNYSSSQIVSRAVAYTCIVSPVEETAGAPKRWSGQFVITPQPTPGDSINWSLGTSANANDNQWKLCRYTGNYVASNGLTNSEHPLTYRGVTGALDNQNYVAVQSNVNCPTDGPPSYSGNPKDYLNSNTTLHQTSAAGALPRGGRLSGDNQPVGAPNNGGFESVEDPSVTQLPMF